MMARPIGLSYSNKVILAPMVRAGRLPMRLLALQYGADIVYSEEHIDLKLVKCKRIENSLLNTVDFVSADGQCQFRTCDLEKERVVFQMGTADPDTALRTARLVENDVAGIDVNMGCPKDYSTLGGMGAALLTQPEKVRSILTTLVQGIRKPVTCKIRLLPSRSDTLKLAKVIESTGVAAMAVHGRYKRERPREACHEDLIREVAESVSIPVIANGGSLKISSYEDILAFRERTGCSSVMVARAALQNPSVFRKEGVLPAEEVAREFVRTSVLVDEGVAIVKYCLSVMLKEYAKLDSRNKIAHKSAAVSSLKEMSMVHDLLPYYESLCAERQELASSLPLLKQQELNLPLYCPVPAKKAKSDSGEGEEEGEGLYELNIRYDKRNKFYSDSVTPKSVILEYARKTSLPPPVFTILEDESRLYRAVVTLGEKKYSSTVWSTSKKWAEHAAAAVALMHRGVLTPPTSAS